jgi:hypothetical protein
MEKSNDVHASASNRVWVATLHGRVFHKLCLNNGQQERIRGRKGISVLLVDRRAVLSPRPNVKGSTRKRGPGPPHHPRVTHLVSHPSSSSSREVQAVGRGLDGRTGRATSWAARGPIRPHKDRKLARAINRRNREIKRCPHLPHPRQPLGRPAYFLAKSSSQTLSEISSAHALLIY